jgi:MFS family permease
MLPIKRNIPLYYTFIFFSSLWIFNVILVLYYQVFNLNFSQIALLGSILSLAIILFEIPSGAFADLIGRKWSIILSQILFIAYLIVLSQSSTIIGFVFSALIFGISFSFISGSKEAFLFDTLKALKRTKEHVKIMGKEHFLFAIAGIISAYLGPTLFEINIYYPIYLSLICMIIALFVALFFYEEKNKNKFTFEEHTNQIKKSLKITFQSKKLLWIIFFTFISAIGFRIFVNITQQPYILEIGFNLKEMAYIFVISAIIGSVCALFFDKFEKILGEKKSLFFLILSQTIIFFMIGFFAYKLNVIFLILFGVIRGYQGITMNDYINKHINSKERATMLSISSFANNLFAAIFLLLIGFIINKSSILTGHIATGLFVTIIGLGLLFYKYKK